MTNHASSALAAPGSSDSIRPRTEPGDKVGAGDETELGGVEGHGGFRKWAEYRQAAPAAHGRNCALQRRLAYCPGVAATRSRKLPRKWLCSAKPVASAASQIGEQVAEGGGEWRRLGAVVAGRENQVETLVGERIAGELPGALGEGSAGGARRQEIGHPGSVEVEHAVAPGGAVFRVAGVRLSGRDDDQIAGRLPVENPLWPASPTPIDHSAWACGR